MSASLDFNLLRVLGHDPEPADIYPLTVETLPALYAPDEDEEGDEEPQVGVFTLCAIALGALVAFCAIVQAGCALLAWLLPLLSRVQQIAGVLCVLAFVLCVAAMGCVRRLP